MSATDVMTRLSDALHDMCCVQAPPAKEKDRPPRHTHPHNTDDDGALMSQWGSFSSSSGSSRSTGGSSLESRHWPQAVVLLFDVQGFTQYSADVDSLHVADYLQRLFGAFDASLQAFDILKIDTVGDAYIAIAVDKSMQRACQHALRFALHVLHVASTVPTCGANATSLGMRAALHCGAVDAIVLQASPTNKYHLIGETFNETQALKRAGRTGAVHCSAQAVHYLLLPDAAEASPPKKRAPKARPPAAAAQRCGGLLSHISIQPKLDAPAEPQAHVQHQQGEDRPWCRIPSYWIQMRADAPVPPGKEEEEVGGIAVVCPRTLRLLYLNPAVLRLFEYRTPCDLRSFRQLQGPLTSSPALREALRECFERMEFRRIITILYTSSTMRPIPIAVSMRCAWAHAAGVHVTLELLDERTCLRL